MNKQWLDGMWDHMRQKYGVYLRVLEAIPADCFAQQPIAGMKSTTQLAVHASDNIVRRIAGGIASGTVDAEEGLEEKVAAGLTSKEDVIAFARACWSKADAAIAKVGDAELAASVENPWGLPLNGAFAMVIINDEFTHHRGQLYAYARACGAEPPFLWSFDQNEAEFQSKQ